MIPLLIFVSFLITLRATGLLGWQRFSSWKACAAISMALIFLFTGAFHFSTRRHDFAAMIPEVIPWKMGWVYVTGVFEIIGGIGLFIPKLKKAAGICLILLLIALFPANVNAYLNDIPFGDTPALNLWIRGPTQLLFLLALYFGAVKATPAPENSPGNTRNG